MRTPPLVLVVDDDKATLDDRTQDEAAERLGRHQALLLPARGRADRGRRQRLEYGIVGRVNRLAAALCNAAPEGHILVSQKIAAAAEEWADFEEIDLPAPRGASRSVRAFKVPGLKGEPC